MNKPDWKDAPEWANYLAQNKDQRWFWHEDEPEINGFYWSGDRKWCFAAGPSDEWKSTLEERPR